MGRLKTPTSDTNKYSINVKYCFYLGRGWGGVATHEYRYPIAMSSSCRRLSFREGEVLITLFTRPFPKLSAVGAVAEEQFTSSLRWIEKWWNPRGSEPSFHPQLWCTLRPFVMKWRFSADPPGTVRKDEKVFRYFDSDS